jgi:hypothetical protein
MRSAWIRRLMSLGGLTAALLLLNSSLTFQSAWPTPGVRWSPTWSLELAVLVPLLLAFRRRLGAPSRRALRWLAAGWLVLVLGHYAEVTAAALYGRDINLFWDLRFVPDVVALMARPERLWVVVLAAAGALLAVAVLFKLLQWAIARLAEATTRTHERRALAVAVSVIALLFVAQRSGAEIRAASFSPPVTQMYVRQVRLMAATLARSTTLAPGPPMTSDLSFVDGADVFLIFIEAYGAVSYERPEYAEPLAADREALEAAVRDTDRGVVSAYVESPTFGGSSWLAHISLMSGVEVRDHDMNAVLMADKRDTLVTTFKRRGYRAVAVVPALWQNWPEGAFYGFDDIYGGARLDYRGPRFGWWDMTDQYALAKVDALEVRRSPRPPLFIFFPTISTHIPFTPTPPYQADWVRVLTESPYEHGDVEAAYLRQPDWMNLGSSYADALSYMYRSLTGYIRLRGDRDFVLILVGDHQPAAAVSGEGAAWTVPVHVVASRRPVLDRLVARGFRAGLTPRGPSLGPMHLLNPLLLGAFGSSEPAPDPAR